MFALLIVLGVLAIGAIWMIIIHIRFKFDPKFRDRLQKEYGESSAMLIRKEAMRTAFSLRKREAKPEECDAHLREYFEPYAIALRDQGCDAAEAEKSLNAFVAMWDSVLEGEFDPVLKCGLERFV